MFEAIHELSLTQINQAVDALHHETTVAVQADPNGATIVIMATPDKPYEVDFVCVTSIETMLPQPMTLADRARLVAWAKRTVPAICRRWKKRHPENAFAPAN